MRETFSVAELCQALGLARSGYYKFKSKLPSPRAKENQALLQTMHEIHSEPYKDSYGSPRMTAELRNRGLACSENRVARLMANEGIKARHKNAFRPKTTVQDPDRAPAKNLLKDDQRPSGPGEVLINDITYVATREGWLYLAVTMDLFHREIVGWHLAESMETGLVIQAASKALESSFAGPGTIYHSDRGCQYTSIKMRTWLKERGMRSSMSAKGYCYDNATCESFFASLKREAFPPGCTFDSKREARSTIFEYIEAFYNRERIHTSLEEQSPEQFLTNFLAAETAHLN